MILPGKYDAVATEHQWGTSANGKTQIAVCFQIIGGPQSGQYITWYGYFTGKAEKITMKALRACGWKGDDLMQLGALDQRVSIVVEHEEHEGKTHAKVQRINAPGGGIALKNPLGESELRMFAAKMKARAAGVKEVAGERVEVDRTTAPAVTHETSMHDGPPPIGDEDLPF
jgi:hypothetical protein